MKARGMMGGAVGGTVAGVAGVLVLLAGVPAAMAQQADGQASGQGGGQASGQAGAAAKIPVKTAADLPNHEYRIEGAASAFLQTDAPFRALVDEVLADANSDLEKYDIQDATTRREYFSLLQQIALFQGRDEDALAYSGRVRELEEKEARKLMTGQVLHALVAARKAGSASSPDLAVFRATLAERVGALPWDVVREEVLQARGRAQLVTRELILGSMAGQIDPVVAANDGVLSDEIARQLVGVRVGMDLILPLNPVIAEVYGGIIERNAKAPSADIWSSRQVSLTEKDKGSPVVIAVWDSGVDDAIFAPLGQAWTNPAESRDGKDNDGNGFIDDVHGIGYDLDIQKVPEPLHPLDELRNDPGLVRAHTKGMMDLQAGVESAEASALRQYAGSLQASDVTAFLEDLNLFGSYSHGTHVAGIAAEGNPFARIMSARITFDFRQIPSRTPTMEQAEASARSAKETVEYFRAHGVRVVNMSWGGSRADIEGALEAKGVGKDAAERRELSAKMFAVQRDALREAMASAPEILFIAAAGNSDNDNTFDELIPSGLTLPNLLTVGAVDASGKPTSFTTFGNNVTLYANGFEVDSFIPGGVRMKFSGTSMAAPQVANLAGKVLAINPSLTPTQLIEVIRATADPMQDNPGRFIINPASAVAKVR